MANLLRRAQDAVDRADWKLAIDSAQRVIRNPQGLRASADDPFLYVSPRRVAQELLAGMPAEGLRSYRILYNGRAKGLLERARGDDDIGALREICDQYLLTRWGPEAANELASRLLDLGRESEALMLLDEVQEVYPDDHDLRARIDLKRAVAANLLGYEKRSRELLGKARRHEGTKARRKEGTEERWDATLDAIRSFMSADRGAGLSRLEKDLSEWTGPGGGGRCRGLMQEVAPVFDRNLPWRRPIPSLAPGVWPHLDAMGPLHMLVSAPVVADGRLFVRAGREILALDLRSFALLWTSAHTAEGIAEHWRASRQWHSGGKGFARSEQRLLSDYVGGTLTTSHGLVLAIERGQGVAFDDDGVAVIPRRGARRDSRTSGTDRELTGNLTAYDASTGRLLWQLGAGANGDETHGFESGGLRFLAPPVGVGGELWVPILRTGRAGEVSGDLYMAVLDPADGRLKRQIFLCAMGGRTVNGAIGLFPAVADGTVYVPTGHGLLFAIKADDYTVRWALRYNLDPIARSRRRNRRQPGSHDAQWLSGPPIVTGATLILGPTDDERLLGIDRLSGKLLWYLQREPHRYIIAADRDSVWVGGGGISRVSLSEQAYEWTTPAYETTGRAVLSGRTIYAPTRAELLAIDADTGEVIERYALPEDQPPLGNLLCIGDSMISLDPSEVRAYPDRGSYDSTLAAFQADPSDARIAVRLAFMELMERRPQRALDALREVRIADSADAEAQWRHVAHLRVEALMQLGSEPGRTSDEAIGFLQEAVSSASEPHDLVAARMALGQKLRSAGRFKQAYLTLWALGQSTLGDQYDDAGPVRRQARIVVGNVLRRIEPELGPMEFDEISAQVGGVLARAHADLNDAAARSGAVQALRALADSRVLDGWDQAALNELGRFELGRGRYERAEQYLTESVRRHDQPRRDRKGARADAPSRRRTAEALLGLLDLYLMPSQSLVVSALEVADRLTDEFADLTIEGASVQSLVDERRRGIDTNLASAHADGVKPSRFTTTTRRAYARITGDAPPALVVGREGRPESLADRELVFVPPRTLRSHLVVDGTLEWKSELLMLLEDFAYDTAGTGTTVSRSRLEQRTAMIDGQTAVITSERGLHAVGTITGIRLWAIEFQGGEHFGDPVLRESTTDVGSGRLACMLAPHRLAVYWMLEDRPLWERNLRGDAVRAVRIRDEFVLSADPNLETVHVFRLDDGAELCTIKFSQPGGMSQTETDIANGLSWSEIPVTYVGGVVCGPEGRNIVGYRASSGERVWTLSLPEHPASLVALEGGRLVVGTASGYHWVVDARDGEVLFERQYDELAGGAVDGVQESGVLVLAGYRETPEGYHWQLLGIDPTPSAMGGSSARADAGRIRWSRDFIGLATGPHLRSVEGVIPIVEMQRVEPQAEKKGQPTGRGVTSHYRQSVVLIDKLTGETVGDPLLVELSAERLTGDIQVWPGRLALQTTKGILTFETTAAATGDRDGVD
ncbi:MAG: PQQ-binding-like beta-propeller repeat protein [Phycisphaerae bacterium]